MLLAARPVLGSRWVDTHYAVGPVEIVASALDGMDGLEQGCKSVIPASGEAEAGGLWI